LGVLREKQCFSPSFGPNRQEFALQQAFRAAEEGLGTWKG